MSSAPLSAASASRARNPPAAGPAVPSSTARSRDAVSALTDRRHRRRGEEEEGTVCSRGKRPVSSTSRSGGSARDGGNPFAFTPVPQRSRRAQEQQENSVRGILHKRRDHLTYGSSAWRPRLFVLDKSNQTLTYYLLSSSRRRETDISSGGIPTTPIPIRGNADSSARMQTPSPSTSGPHPLDATIDALSLDVNPRGVISLRNCIVRAVDDATVDATLRTPGRPRNQEGGNEGRLFAMVLSSKWQRRQGGSANAASAPQLKNDIFLATSTEDDRNQWLRHLAMACGMAASPVPGGLRSASAPPPSVGRRREVAEAPEEQTIGGGAETVDNGSVVEASGEVKDLSQRNRPPSSAVATPVPVGLGTPLRSAARRIFDTPSAVASGNEAGSSTISSGTSRSTSAIGGVAVVKNKHFSMSTLTVSPLFKLATILFAPPILVRIVRNVAPLSPLPQLFLFLLLVRWSIRQVILTRYLGHPVSDRGALHGPVTCRIQCDLRGVLRFIGNKREEHTPLRGTGSSSSLSHVSVTHIVAKAVATALCEVTPELNCHYRNFSLFGLEGWYPNKGGVSISIVSTHSQRVSTIRGTEECTVQEIADKVWKDQHDKSKRAAIAKMQRRVDLVSLCKELSYTFSQAKENLFHLLSGSDNSCIIYTSPDSENNEVEIDVAPRPEGAPIVVVVGGVRVVDRDPRNTSSRQMRWPMLSICISIDCPMSNVANSRKLAEKIQTHVQFPEENLE